MIHEYHLGGIGFGTHGWPGLDVVMADGLSATAWLAVRCNRRMAFPAVATATLLLADAWFVAPAGAVLILVRKWPVLRTLVSAESWATPPLLEA